MKLDIYSLKRQEDGLEALLQLLANLLLKQTDVHALDACARSLFHCATHCSESFQVRQLMHKCWSTALAGDILHIVRRWSAMRTWPRTLCKQSIATSDPALKFCNLCNSVQRVIQQCPLLLQDKAQLIVGSTVKELTQRLSAAIGALLALPDKELQEEAERAGQAGAGSPLPGSPSGASAQEEGEEALGLRVALQRMHRILLVSAAAADHTGVQGSLHKLLAVLLLPPSLFAVSFWVILRNSFTVSMVAIIHTHDGEACSSDCVATIVVARLKSLADNLAATLSPRGCMSGGVLFICRMLQRGALCRQRAWSWQQRAC
jgi:hypothetical protein